MAYTPFHVDWKPKPDPSTPISDVALEHIEGGLQTAAAIADTALADAAGAQATADLVPLGSLMRPMSKTLYGSDCTLCTLSATTPPAWSSSNPYNGTPQHMSYPGAILTDNGGGFGINRITGNPSQAYSPYFVEFNHSGTDFVLYNSIPSATSTDWNVWVDGKPIFAEWQNYGGGMDAFTFTYLHMQFTQDRNKTITFAQSDQRALGGTLISTGVPGSIWPAEPRPAKLALIGDSFGSYAYPTTDPAGTLHTGVLGTELSIATGFEVFSMCQPSTGYLADGHSIHASNAPYGHSSRMSALAALPALDAIIVFGGLNDPFNSFTPTQIQNAATALYAAIATARPNTPVIVVGVQNWEGVGAPSAPTLIAADNAIAAAAAAAPNVAGFISMLQPAKWWSGTGKTSAPNGTGPADQIIANDGLHPSHFGQRTIARRLAAALAPIKV